MHCLARLARFSTRTPLLESPTQPSITKPLPALRTLDGENSLYLAGDYPEPRFTWQEDNTESIHARRLDLITEREGTECRTMTVVAAVQLCYSETLLSLLINMSHKFGNIDSWTKDKLERIEAYLDAYLKALKNQNFVLEYIDAFAGTGYVSRKVEMQAESLFDIEETVKLRDFIDGSARVALQTNPPFSRYRFIEKHSGRCGELEKLKLEFPPLADRIEVICGDANTEVQRLCSIDWISARRRGVMFLDPYGHRLLGKQLWQLQILKRSIFGYYFPLEP
jgi:hypothetical protein